MGINFPNTPLVGDLWPNPPVAGQPVYTWDGEKWTSGTGYGNIYIADSAPAAPVGSLWWESDTGILFVRYNDGTSTQWVAIANGGAGAVRFDVPQTLSSAQQAQAATNIASVQYIAQTLTTPQQAQVAANVAAIQYTAQTLTAPQKAQANVNIGSLPILGGTTTGAVTVTGNFTVTGQIFAYNDTNAGFTTGGANRYIGLISGLGLASLNDGHMTFLGGGANSFRVQNDGNILMLAGHIPYKPGGGPWVDNSDARIKNVLGNYEHGLNEILALQPVRYTYKGNNTGPDETPSSLQPGAVLEEGKDAPPLIVPYPNSPHYTEATAEKEFIGLIAQEVETVIPEMVSLHDAMIDGEPVTDLRTLDTGPLLFALINSCKELAARVAELEGAR